MFHQDYMTHKTFADSIRESPSPYNEAGRRGFWERSPEQLAEGVVEAVIRRADKDKVGDIRIPGAVIGAGLGYALSGGMPLGGMAGAAAGYHMGKKNTNAHEEKAVRSAYAEFKKVMKREPTESELWETYLNLGGDAAEIKRRFKESGNPATTQNRPNQHLICSGVQDYSLGKQTEVGPWRAHKSLSEYHGEEAFGSLLGY